MNGIFQTGRKIDFYFPYSSLSEQISIKTCKKYAFSQSRVNFFYFTKKVQFFKISNSKPNARKAAMRFPVCDHMAPHRFYFHHYSYQHFQFRNPATQISSDSSIKI